MNYPPPAARRLSAKLIRLATYLGVAVGGLAWAFVTRAPHLFTQDVAVIAAVRRIAPLLWAALAVHAATMCSEGLLIGTSAAPFPVVDFGRLFKHSGRRALSGRLAAARLPGAVVRGEYRHLPRRARRHRFERPRAGCRLERARHLPTRPPRHLRRALLLVEAAGRRAVDGRWGKPGSSGACLGKILWPTPSSRFIILGWPFVNNNRSHPPACTTLSSRGRSPSRPMRLLPRRSTPSQTK